MVRLARHLEVPSALLVDGVVEWAHTMRNPWLGRRHLRQAPEDLVLAMGEIQGDILRALGNKVVVCGLPRLDGFKERVAHAREGIERAGPPRVVVATANCPAIGRVARTRVVRCLLALRDSLNQAGVHAVWRLTDGLCEELGVRRDAEKLEVSLAHAGALISTASTIVVEGMLAGVPTCVLHPHPWPLWVPGAWEWRHSLESECTDFDPATLRESAAASDAASASANRYRGDTDASVVTADEPLSQQAAAVLAALLTPDVSRRAVQDRLLTGLHTPNAAQRTAVALADLAKDGRPQAEPPPIEEIVSSRLTVPPSSGRPVVVSLVVSRDWPARAVASWSRTMGRTYTDEPERGYAFHTLHVTTDPIGYAHVNEAYDPNDPCQHLVTLDPTEGTDARLRRVVSALASLSPSIVIPNESDLAFAACAHARNHGARTLVVAHHDAESMRHELGIYRGRDAIVHAGPPNATAPDWLRAVAGDQPIPHIPYGVRVLDERARVSDGVLRLISVGAVMRERMRSFDLIELLLELRRLDVPFLFDLVGAGPDFAEWQREARSAGFDAGTVTVHGSLPPWEIDHLYANADASVLVSEAEGAGMAMLEAMGAGVIPCVTQTGGGASRLIADGRDGVLVPVGAMVQMARRLSDLARSAELRTAMSHAAQARVSDAGLSASRMTERYAELFDAILNSDAPRAPNDDAVRLTPSKTVRHADDPSACDDWLRAALAESGYASVALGEPGEGADAVLVRAGDPRPTPSQIDEWRASGLGVAVSPNLCVDPEDARVERALQTLIERGCTRVGVWAEPGLMHLCARLVEHGTTIVGVIDAAAEPGDTHLALPAIRDRQARASLGIDGVLLIGGAGNPDRDELVAELRDAGIPCETVKPEGPRPGA